MKWKLEWDWPFCCNKVHTKQEWMNNRIQPRSEQMTAVQSECDSSCHHGGCKEGGMSSSGSDFLHVPAWFNPIHRFNNDSSWLIKEYPNPNYNYDYNSYYSDVSHNFELVGIESSRFWAHNHTGSSETQVIASNGWLWRQLNTHQWLPPPGSICCGPVREHGCRPWHDGAGNRTLRTSGDC